MSKDKLHFRVCFCPSFWCHKTLAKTGLATEGLPRNSRSDEVLRARRGLVSAGRLRVFDKSVSYFGQTLSLGPRTVTTPRLSRNSVCTFLMPPHVVVKKYFSQAAAWFHKRSIFNGWMRTEVEKGRLLPPTPWWTHWCWRRPSRWPKRTSACGCVGAFLGGCMALRPLDLLLLLRMAPVRLLPMRTGNISALRPWQHADQRAPVFALGGWSVLRWSGTCSYEDVEGACCCICCPYRGACSCWALAVRPMFGGCASAGESMCYSTACGKVNGFCGP